MQKESWKVFLASALGAGVGSLVGLQLDIRLCWIGLIVGGLTGYLSYEWRRVYHAVPHAWRAATKWRFPRWAAKQGFWLGVCGANFSFLLVALSSLKPGVLVDWQVLLLVSTLFSVAMGCMLFVIGFIDGVTEDEDACIKKTSTIYTVAINTFPPVAIFWHLPRGLYFVVRHVVPRVAISVSEDIWVVVCFLGRFFWQVFIRIHSERRLICGVDAMIGAAIGLAFHHALIGALAGGIIGLINYALITERWLKPHGYVTAKS
ncbi:MAG: hypothetical protein PHS79_01275 [Patescibacteria group bacterium]|nr:hypothetical protein [Patescibacteria group bacterium]